MNLAPPCPLCAAGKVQPFHADRKRRYWGCLTCDLVFVSPEQLPSLQVERSNYDFHQNSPNDAGYRRFLGRLVAPLCERLTPAQQQGLDFGCGPGPALSAMLVERGLTVDAYDPIYAPGTNRLQTQYDFVTCTEAVEHFHRPAREWSQLLALLKPTGWLGIMTKLHRGKTAFSTWHYKNDPTHVSFFSRRTFEYLAHRDQLRLEFIGDDVVLFQN